MPGHPRETQLHPARDSVTLDFYSASVPIYLGSGARGVSRHLPSFLDLLPPRARILELGCGGERDAAVMIVAGFDVDPTEVVLRLPEKPRSGLADLSAWCILISLMLLKPMTPSGRTRAYCTYLEVSCRRSLLLSSRR